MTVDFVTFALGPDELVMSQSDYLALAARLTGFQVGVAEPTQLNKVWRQSAFISACLANYVSQVTGQDVLDNGDTAAFITLLSSAFASATTRTITAAGPQNVLSSDRNLFINQTVNAAITLLLPASPSNQEVAIFDGKGNCESFPITVSGNGHNIAGLTTKIINQNYGAFTFVWNSTIGMWFVK